METMASPPQSNECRNCSEYNRSSITQFHSILSTFLNEQPQPLFDSFIVAVDIGATHTRTCFTFLQRSGTTVKELHVPRLRCNQVLELVDTFHYLSTVVQQAIPHMSSAASAVAVAGPVNRDRDYVKLTNYAGDNTSLSVSQLPSFLFPQEKGKTRFLNDLEAACYGIIYIGQRRQLGDYFEPAFEPTGATKPSGLEDHHYAVLAMGTGLGTGMIVSLSNLSTKSHTAADPPLKFSVMPLEAGHCLVPHASAVYHTEDAKCLDQLSRDIYDAKHTLEFEDICSGRGLRACYLYELSQAGLPIPNEGVTSEQIAAYALMEISEDTEERMTEYKRAASRAMTTHYTCLMKAAQNLCVMVPACKGLFLAGDNQVINQRFFLRHEEHFKNEFFNHPKRNWLEEKKVFRQTQVFNFNLVGAVWVACNEILQQQ